MIDPVKNSPDRTYLTKHHRGYSRWEQHLCNCVSVSSLPPEFKMFIHNPVTSFSKFPIIHHVIVWPCRPYGTFPGLKIKAGWAPVALMGWAGDHALQGWNTTRTPSAGYLLPAFLPAFLFALHCLIKTQGPNKCRAILITFLISSPGFLFVVKPFFLSINNIMHHNPCYGICCLTH